MNVGIHRVCGEPQGPARAFVSPLQPTIRAGLVNSQVQLAVEKFALTANNITYATQGDTAEFWRFFPPPEPAWGIVPAMGYERVTQSRHDDLSVEARVFGFLPMASH